MQFLILCILIIEIIAELKVLSSYLVSQVQLDIQHQDFGFGGYFQYSPIIYQTQDFSLTTYPKMLLGALIQKETQIAQMILYAQLNSLNQVIDHVLILDSIEVLKYSVQPLEYEGKWFLFYFQYQAKINEVQLTISDAELNQKQISTFYNQFDVLQTKYLVQYAGFFKNIKENVYYQFYKGLYFQILNTTVDFAIISESQIFSDTESARCSCEYASTLSNQDLYIFKSTYYQGSVSQGCYDYAIQTWVQVIDYFETLPIEIISVSHNQNADYYNHIGGIAFRMYYQYVHGLLNVDVVTYSYTFPSIEVEEHPDPNLISFQFKDIQANISNWHFFKFEKQITQTTFTLTFPIENIQITKAFEQLYQFSLPKLNYYLGGSLLSKQNITAKYYNLTIDHCYEQADYKLVCHISCFTCKGPTIQDCTSCHSFSNRNLIGNLCACKLGYFENYLESCLYYNNEFLNLSSIPIPTDNDVGYQQRQPYLICEYGYFQMGDLCVKCPSIYNENIITCLDCLLQQYIWQFSLICQNDLVKVFEIFQSQSNIRYFYFDNKALIECVKCSQLYSAYLDSQDQYYLRLLELPYGDSLYIECEYGYYYKDLKCLRKESYLQSEQLLNCGQFCEQCDDQGICLYCQQGQYFISSDGINCEICLIDNCESCYIFDIDDKFYETLSQQFIARKRTSDTLRVGCAKCKKGLYFDFTSLQCTLESSINNCQQQIQHNNEIICLISILTDFSISDAIDNCRQQLSNCKQCHLNRAINQIKCNICEIGYYVNRGTGLCIKCSYEDCLVFDAFRQDQWLQQLEPFYNIKYSQNPLYTQDLISNFEERQNCDKFACDICNQDLTCFSCPNSRYGESQQSLNQQFCQECSQLCNVCVIRGAIEYSLINPHFINELEISDSPIEQCLKSNNQGYINGDNVVLLCDEKPCKLVGDQKKSLSCLTLTMLTTSRMQAPLDDGIDFDYLKIKAIEQFNFEYQLNFQGDCSIFNFVMYTQLRQIVSSVRVTTVRLKGMFHQLGYLSNENWYYLEEDTKVSIQKQLAFLNYQIVYVEDITFSPRHESLFNVFEIQNSQQLIDAYLTNLIILDIYQSKFSFYFNFLNLKYLSICNFTLINTSAIGVNFFNVSVKIQQQNQIKMIIQNMSIINSTFQNGCFLNITDVNMVNVALHIENLYISNSYFNDYDFLFITGNGFLGKFENFNNITIENCTFINSTFLNLNFDSDNNSIIQLTLKNSIFKNQSRLISSNKINFAKINILDNQFYDDSQLVYMKYEYASNNTFCNSQIRNNNVQTNQPLIQIQSPYSFFTYSQITIFNNTHSSQFINPIIQNTVQFLQIIEIQIYNDLFNQMVIFQLQSIYEIQIQNITIQQINNKNLNVLTSKQECFQLQDTYNVFKIQDCIIITIKNLNVTKFIVISNPVISIISNFLQPQYFQLISLEDITFSEILLVKTISNQLITIISINNQNSINIDLSYCKFEFIWMHQYEPDYDALSSAILSINSVYAITKIHSSYFSQIMLTNSTNSIMKFNVQTLIIQNSEVQYINQRNSSFFNQFLFWDMNYESYTKFSQLEAIFEIKSDGGFLNIQAQNLNLNHLVVDRCYAQNGGFAKIATKGKGVLNIINSHFSNTEAFVKSQQSKGGLFYIQSDNSLLNLYIYNCSTNYSMARQQGGSIFIVPSTINNQIIIRESNFANSFSDEGAIMTAKFLDSTMSKITFDCVQISSILIEEYIQKLNYISQAEAVNIQVKNYAVVVYQSSSFHLKNCNFYNQDFTGFLNVENTPEILIYNVTFQKFTFTVDSAIYIGYTKKYNINILADKITIRDGLPKTFEIDDKIICEQQQTEQKTWYCNQPYTNPKVLFDYNDKRNTTNCIKQQIFNIVSTRNYSAIIAIDCNKNDAIIKISRLEIHNILMSDNNYGLFQLILNKLEGNICQFSEIIISSNTCGLNGCFLLIQTDLIGTIQELTDDLNILESDHIKNTRILQNTNKNYIIMNDCLFFNNSAFKGAGVVIVNLNVIIQNSQFIANTAQSSGGFLYYFQIDQEIILSNILALDNFAPYGQIFKIGNHLPITTTSVNIYGQFSQISYAEYPVALTIIINSNQLSTYSIITQNTHEDAIVIKPYKILGQKLLTDFLWFPSGQYIGNYSYFDYYSQIYIPLNISVAIIPLNSKNEQISHLQNSNCKLSQRIINSEQSLSQDYQELGKVLFNDSTQNYNLDYTQFTFDPYQQSNNYLSIKVQCDCIQDQNYFFTFKIKTYECQLGEYYYYGQCLNCNPDYSYYSLDPKYGKCEILNAENTIAIKSAMVQLKQSFWRYKVKSNIISYCINNPMNCEGGWDVGQDSCKIGQIGALCEECDIYNIRGGGKYSKTNDYSCTICSEFSATYIKAAAISIWTLISVFLTCNSVIQSNKQLIKLKLMNKHFKILHKLDQSIQLSILIKMTTYFIQIISIVSSFHLKLNFDLNLGLDLIGNPVKQISTLIDCSIANSISLDLAYYRVILYIILTLMLINVCFVFYAILLRVKKIKFNNSIIWIIVIYIFLLTQPGHVNELSSIIAYRTIAKEKWVKAQVSLLYETQNHYFYILVLFLPFSILIIILIPSYLTKELYKGRHSIFEKKFRQKFSYLINEYREDIWYWEIFKVFKKVLIIVSLNLYSDFISIKSSLVYLIIIIYLIFLLRFQPYNSNILTKLEVQSVIIQILVIILAAACYQAQIDDNSIQFFYLIIIISIIVYQLINFLFKIFGDVWKTFQKKIELLFMSETPMINNNTVINLVQAKIIKSINKKEIQSNRIKLLKSKIKPQISKITELKSCFIQDIEQQIVRKKADDPQCQFVQEGLQRSQDLESLFTKRQDVLIRRP